MEYGRLGFRDEMNAPEIQKKEESMSEAVPLLKPKIVIVYPC
jgi:hypothetical protein